MKIPVWHCLTAAACGLASALVCAQVRDFPSRPVRIVVPSGPGAILDLVGRIIGPAMADGMGQSVVVDNRPGAGTNIGMEIVARAPGDGYTLLVASNGLTVNPGIYPKLPFDVRKDLAPVSLVFDNAPYLLVVHPSVPVRSLRELVTLVKARPGALNHSSGGYGTNIYVMGELFKHLTGTDMLHVPYKSGGQAVSAVMGGEASMTFFALAAILPQVNAGKLRALAITSIKRSALVPAIPTVSEAGVPGYEFTSWVGILTSGTTPAGIVAALNGYVVKAVRASGLAERFANEGADILAGSPEQFGAHITKELARWSKVIKELGLRAE